MVLNGVLNPKYLLCFFIPFIFSCGESAKEKKANQTPVKKTQQLIERPNFDKDSAYAYIEKQISFGTKSSKY